jgi:hypothetical protein
VGTADGTGRRQTAGGQLHRAEPAHQPLLGLHSSQQLKVIIVCKAKLKGCNLAGVTDGFTFYTILPRKSKNKICKRTKFHFSKT